MSGKNRTYGNPSDYDLLAKVKEPLRGTRYNTRDELIRAIGRAIRNINKNGRADGVQRLPNIWQNVINKGGIILNVHKCCILVNNATSGISNCCHYFLSNPGRSGILYITDVHLNSCMERHVRCAKLGRVTATINQIHSPPVAHTHFPDEV